MGSIGASNWTPESWKTHEARHLPAYQDAEALGRVETTLGNFPPLVFAGEARALKADLAEVAAGRRLVCGDRCGATAPPVLSLSRSRCETARRSRRRSSSRRCS